MKKDPVVDKPKPYDYGMVGQQSTHPAGMSPPNSPPTTNASLGNDTGTYSPPPQHIRNPSQTPLLAGMGAGLAASAAAANSHSSRPSISRPSTAGSTNVIGPLVSNAPQGMGYPPTTTYPPALQNWTQQSYAPSQGQSVGQAGQAQGVNQLGQLQSAGHVQGQGLVHNQSVVSTASTPSMYSTNTIGPWSGASSSGTASGSASASGSGMPALIPLVAATGAAAGAGMGLGMAASRPQQQQQQHPLQPQHHHHQQQHQQHPLQPQPQQQYEDPFARSGSPVSIQEQRILQVTNADTSSILGSPGPVRSSVLAGPGPSSSAFGAAFASGSGSGAGGSAGPSASTATRPSVTDGKGRPLNMLGEKAPLVHLDGGLYQEPLPGQVRTPGPAPPAYME